MEFRVHISSSVTLSLRAAVSPKHLRALNWLLGEWAEIAVSF